MKALGERYVADYMTEQALVVDDTARLTAAIRLMDEERIKVLPVVDQDGRVVGILSTSDLIEITHEIQADLSALRHVEKRTQEFLVELLVAQGDNTKVSDVMTAPVMTTTPTTNLIVAARQMAENGHQVLPVVDGAARPVGILSASDFVRAITDFGSRLAGSE